MQRHTQSSEDAADLEDALDFCSPSFQPALALQAISVAPPRPNVKVFQTLNEYVVALKKSPLANTILTEVTTEGLNIKDGSSRKQAHVSAAEERQRRLQKLENITLPGVQTTVECDGEERAIKGVFERMQDYTAGPFTLLKRCVQEGIKLRVWTRKARGIRGVCCGFLIAFDKHMNLAMIDVSEFFTVEELATNDTDEQKKEDARQQKKHHKKKMYRLKQRKKLTNNPMEEHSATGNNAAPELHMTITSQTADSQSQSSASSCATTVSNACIKSSQSIGKESTAGIDDNVAPVGATCQEETSVSKGNVKPVDVTVKPAPSSASTSIMPVLNVKLLDSLSSYIKDNPAALQMIGIEGHVASKCENSDKRCLRKQPLIVPDSAGCFMKDPRTSLDASRSKNITQLKILKFQYAGLNERTRLMLRDPKHILMLGKTVVRDKSCAYLESTMESVVNNDGEKESRSLGTRAYEPTTQPGSMIVTSQIGTAQVASCSRVEENTSLNLNNLTDVCEDGSAASFITAILGTARTLEKDSAHKEETTNSGQATDQLPTSAEQTFEWKQSRLLRERSVYRQPVKLVKQRRHLNQVLIRGENVVMVSYDSM